MNALCELGDEGFDALVDEIMSLGYSEELAARYAALIGDTPCADQDCNVIVSEGGVELARLKLSQPGALLTELSPDEVRLPSVAPNPSQRP